ncbi:DUF7289 family protein [Halosimplex marinum]|uniref:DUF7289 family protein n=1 Tax=Halosimplex marinum TaxID=3396620 RepID=UPI003F54A3C4
MQRGVCRGGGRRRGRAQSDVLAVVLLATMVIAGATTVVVAGTAALNQGQGDASSTAAVQSMQSLDTTIEQMARGGSSQAQVEAPDLQGNFQVVSESTGEPARAGRVTVTVDPPSGSDTTEEFWLGTARYERDGQTVAYQGGGVWRKTGNGSVAVSRPGISYRSNEEASTLTFPITTIEGTTGGGEFRVETVDQRDLLSSVGMSNRMPSGTTIDIAIESTFYRAWGEHLQSELGPESVTVDPATETVTVTVESPNVGGTVSSAAYSDGPSSALTNTVTTDSYLSPDYAGSPHNENGDVLTTETFDPTNDFTVRGDVHAESGAPDITNEVEVTGNVVLGQNAGGPTQINSQPTFHSVFSTKDDLTVVNEPEFEGDVLVGGASGNDYSLQMSSGQPAFRQDVFVEGNLEIGYSSDPVVEGDVYVRNGDIEQLSSVDTIDGNVYVEDGDAKIGEDYSGGVTIQGDVVVDEDVDLGGDTVDINGDVIAGGTVHNGPEDADVAGNVRDGEPGTVSSRLAAKTFETPLDPSVPDYESAESTILDKESSYSATNDNGDVSAISGTDLGSCDPTCVLPAGDYYVDDIDMGSGDTLRLDTTGGEVNVYVDGNIQMDNDAEIVIEGSNRANVYVGASGGNALSMVNTAEIRTSPEADRAPLFWMYLRPDAQVQFSNDAVYTGVLFGPGGSSTDGAEIQVVNRVEIFGSLIGEVTQMSNDAQVHYDENLGSTRVYGGGSGGPATVDFVYLRHQTATVDD